jgi:hypothetical protein
VVQSVHGYVGTLVSSQSVTFGAPVASGDLIVVAVSSWNPTNTSIVNGVTDCVGNSYTQAITDPVPATSGEGPLSIWYAANAKPGSNVTVTVQVGTAGSLTVAVHEYSGVVTTNVVDQVAHASGTGSTASSGLTATTTNANDLLFGASDRIDVSTVGVVAGSGFTLRQSQTNNICCNALATEDEVVSETGQYGATFAYATSVTYRDALVAFRGR